MSKGRTSGARFVQRALGKDEDAAPRRDANGRIVVSGFPVFRFVDSQISIWGIPRQASLDDNGIILPKIEDDRP